MAFVGGAIHDALLDVLDGYDGYLLLGEEPELKTLAAAFGRRGGAVWYDWAAIPPVPTVAC